MMDDRGADDTEGDDTLRVMTIHDGWQTSFDDDFQSMTNKFDDRFAERHPERSSHEMCKASDCKRYCSNLQPKAFYFNLHPKGNYLMPPEGAII